MHFPNTRDEVTLVGDVQQVEPVQQLPRTFEMYVVVVEAGYDQSAVQVDYPRPGAYIRIHTRVRTGIYDAVAYRSYRFRARVGVVDGPDDATTEHEVRFLGVYGRRKREPAKEEAASNPVHLSPVSGGLLVAWYLCPGLTL